jgi:hypothetical protein
VRAPPRPNGRSATARCRSCRNGACGEWRHAGDQRLHPSGYKPFGELTHEDVTGHARELAGAAGWAPTARVASVARASSELVRVMAEAGAGTVAELDPAVIEDYAQRTWVAPKLLG